MGVILSEAGYSKDKDRYNIGNKQQVDLDFELICDICSKLQDSPSVVTEAEVEQIIKTLKNNKASDGCGLAAEHLKYEVEGGKSWSLSRVSWMQYSGLVKCQKCSNSAI